MITLDEAFARLRQANEPVPKPMRLPTLAEVDMAERDLGVRFHPDYRRFQLEVSDVNACVLEPARVLPDLMPYINLRSVTASARSLGAPHDVVPFCEDNGGYYFIDSDGRIGLWEDGFAYMKYDSFADWIVGMWLGDDWMEDTCAPD